MDSYICMVLEILKMFVHCSVFEHVCQKCEIDVV